MTEKFIFEKNGRKVTKKWIFEKCPKSDLKVNFWKNGQKVTEKWLKSEVILAWVRKLKLLDIMKT